ncbi:hypothetical protein GUJ93_ZPchr0010g10566 [Zizania palustris]|uniref:Pectinesterase inhibitor domain-containing protein n=1 Tax=Zizania palustris TaxID=103762 RepID=A0A8J5W8R8_ZIZPA|nr:hypothetical protein GUJ93_ZPchr0010g10566 [Zizania palustris]
MGLAHGQRLVLLAAVALLSAGFLQPALAKKKRGRCAILPQVEAFAKRTKQARKRVTKVSRRTTPQQTQALSFCDTMYMNTQDTIGAAQRAITFKDKATAKIMLQLAVQDFESCDRPFKQAGIKNPMEKFDSVLNQMASNCMTLANMIV